ncbi:MAG: ATP-binding cassette domain-containing protein [Calditrichia bacterium]
MLKLNNLHFAYADSKVIFKGLSIKFQVNKIYGIVGENGSGKTTLFNLLMNRLQPQQGEIELRGFHHVNNKQEYQNSIIFSNDEPEFPGYLTGKEWLEFVLKAYAVPFDEILFAELSEVFAFPEIHARIAKYSHGMNKKLSMMINFMVNPACMIFDESMAGIDPFTLKAIYQYIREARLDRIILISSHSRELLESCADELWQVQACELRLLQHFDDIFIDE